MNKKNEKNLIVGLDIGTSKVVAIVGEVSEDGEIEVVGIGTHPSRGLKKGVVVKFSYKYRAEEVKLVCFKRLFGKLKIVFQLS